MFTDRELIANGVDPFLLRARRWRRAHNLSHKEFAQLLGIKHNLSGVETGKRPITAAQREALEMFFAESPADAKRLREAQPLAEADARRPGDGDRRAQAHGG